MVSPPPLLLANASVNIQSNHMTRYSINSKCQTKVNVMLPVNYRQAWLQAIDGMTADKELLKDCVEYLVNVFSGQEKYIHLKGWEQGLLMLVKMDVLKKLETDDKNN